MACPDLESLVSYVRGRSADPRGVEAHVRDCPACAMQLLLTRETLGDLRAKAARPPTDRLRALPAKPRSASWIPWAAAAAVLVAALVVAVVATRPAPAPLAVKVPDKPKPVVPVAPEIPKPAPEQPPRPVPLPAPEVPKPLPEAPPAPKPESAPPVPEPRRPEPPPAKPVPEPAKPAPTLVEKAVVARVIHSMGGANAAVGRAIRAGDLIATARQEFLAVAVEGYGQLYFRENSQAQIGPSGDISLQEGEMLARLDPGMKWGSIKTPLAPIEPTAPVVDVQMSKSVLQVSVLSGRIMVSLVPAVGPATVVVKNGKASELRPLDPGFAGWLPDKLASKRFSGWYEAEDFPTLQGFKAMPVEQASARQAAVQVADAGAIATKIALPFKGRHAVWIRAKQYEAKSAAIGIHVNGQAAGEVKLDFSEGKVWRWVGPLIVNADRLDLEITALSRWPLKQGAGDNRSFPVVIDCVLVASDPKAVPPEKPGDDARGVELVLDEPVK